MRSVLQVTPPRLLRCALAAGAFLCLSLGGCNEVDPLEAIRQQQGDSDFEGSIEPLRELLSTRPDDAHNANIRPTMRKYNSTTRRTKRNPRAVAHRT